MKITAFATVKIEVEMSTYSIDWRMEEIITQVKKETKQKIYSICHNKAKIVSEPKVSIISCLDA